MKFFSKISSIPRGSKNTAAIADYCEKFAAERGHKFVKDDYGNVVIYANATCGFDNAEIVVIQGHMDMVCEKTAECTKNMLTDGLELRTDGEYIWADGTTLGGDDGIAVAYALALLDSDDIPRPPLEILLTSDEEIGLLGAADFDVAMLKGKRLINIDSEEEGILTVSCAGGVRALCTLPLNFEENSEFDCCYEISLYGFKGGHSGIDINKHRKNALKVMGRFLEYVQRKCQIRIAYVNGGAKENVIPKQADAGIFVKSEEKNQFEKAVQDFSNIMKNECQQIEPDVNVKICEVDKNGLMTDDESTKKLVFAILQVANGVQSYSPDIPDMVQTSLNLGCLSTDNNALNMGFLIRSNASTGKQFTVLKLSSFMEYLGGMVEYRADYPAWEYRAKSPLRDIMVKAYETVYADKPQVCAVHAGLECGIFPGKMPDADMVSFGPDIENVHTPDERMSVSSVQRCWDYLLEVLKLCTQN